ncbi:MAG: hypothetical protein Q8L48_16805 [Archangium sp.]|nr:hypothetical protein [Archangium sp.]
MGCGFDSCDRPVEKGGLCAGHRKQKQRGGRLEPLNDALAGRLTPAQNLHEAAMRLADSDSEDDRAFSRNIDSHRKAAITYARHHQVVKTLEAFDRRREAGLRVAGPAPKLSAAGARAAVDEAGGIRAAARLLKVSRNTVRAALRRRLV